MRATDGSPVFAARKGDDGRRQRGMYQRSETAMVCGPLTDDTNVMMVMTREGVDEVEEHDQ